MRPIEILKKEIRLARTVDDIKDVLNEIIDAVQENSKSVDRINEIDDKIERLSEDHS